MDSKKAGWLFLLEVLISLGASLMLSLGGPFLQLSFVRSAIFSELIIVGPAGLFLLLFERNLFRNDSTGKYDGLIALGNLRILGLPLLGLFTILITPLVTLCNLLTMFVTENEVAGWMDEMIAYPFWLMLLIVGIVGPLCEELVFRGVLYGAFRRSGNIVGAIVLQGVLFGLFHENLNQFGYACAIGIILGFVVEATGSIWGSFCIHMYINSFEVILMYAMSDMQSPQGKIAPELLLYFVSVYSFLALITTALAVCLLYGIACIHGRGRVLLQLIKSQKRGKVLSIQTFIGMALCVIIIVLELIVKNRVG